MKNRLQEPVHERLRLARSPFVAFIAFAALGLAGCGVVSTAVVVTSVAVDVATTAVGVAVDGAVLAGKGVVKTGEVIADAVSDDDGQE